MVTVKPLLIAIGPALIPLVNFASPFAVGPIVIFSAIVAAFVLITLSVPTAGPPPEIDAQPALPVPVSYTHLTLPTKRIV